ncbi:hemolysin family protein [Spirillospora sp. NPDC029432]|uniref:hemolysin family protein n=1 Tax=Spirillospora sp. NPDC029432 TaxID=3154599 RepID=UPI0034511E13
MDEHRSRRGRALARPLARLTARSAGLAARLAGEDPGAPREMVTAARVRALIAANTEIAADERALIEEVFAAAERPLREVLVPRTEVEFLDAGLTLAAAARIAAGSPHSRFPVCSGSHDEVIGFVHIRDLLVPEVADRGVPVGELVRPVPYLPASRRVLPVLSEMRREGHHLAIVMDEYGGTAGIVTLEDLVEELIGDIRDEYDVQDAQAQRLHGGVVEVDGLLNLDDFAAETGVRLPDGPYETVAGHIMAALGRVPAAGDAVAAAGCRLSVVRMDGRRVARVRVTPSVPGQPGPGQQPGPAQPVPSQAVPVPPVPPGPLVPPVAPLRSVPPVPPVESGSPVRSGAGDLAPGPVAGAGPDAPVPNVPAPDGVPTADGASGATAPAGAGPATPPRARPERIDP